jgi:hypothetical protein
VNKVKSTELRCAAFILDAVIGSRALEACLVETATRSLK